MLGRATGNTDTQDSPQPGLGGGHHLPPYSILYDSPQSPHPNGYFSRDSWVRVPKSRQMGLPGLWSPITLRADLGSQCGLKQSCSSRRELSNAVLHSRIGHREEVDSWLFVVRSQTGSSTSGPSFGHNLCFRCSNELCKPILDIYAPRAFQWYKECHNPLRFDPCNRSLKFRESTGTPSPKVGVAVGVWVFTPAHSLTLSNTPGNMWCDSRASFCLNSQASSWPVLLQCLCLDSRASFLSAHNLATPLALVASPKLRLRHFSSHSCLVLSIISLPCAFNLFHVPFMHINYFQSSLHTFLVLFMSFLCTLDAFNPHCMHSMCTFMHARCYQSSLHMFYAH